mgnify:CR=1 FL=1
MKCLACIFILIFFWSCRQENFKKTEANEIAKKELENIKYNEVDQFPLFQSCDETVSRLAQKTCFEKQLHLFFKSYLDTLHYNNADDDTINLSLSINTDGKLKLDSISSKPSLTKTFKEIVEQSPKIYPAQKRGIPTKISFQLPIILTAVD